MACAQPATTPRLVDNPTAIGERQTGRTPDARGVALARVPAHCQARRGVVAGWAQAIEQQWD